MGLIGAGVAVVGLLIGGIWLYNKWKNFKFDSAHKKQNEDAAKDHATVIDKNTEHNDDDDKTFDQSKKDKEGAFDGEQS